MFLFIKFLIVAFQFYGSSIYSYVTAILMLTAILPT